MPKMAKQVKKLMPAGDWFAILDQSARNEKDELERLVAWALVEEEDGYASIEGLSIADGVPNFCEECVNFAGYIHWADIPSNRQNEYFRDRDRKDSLPTDVGEGGE